MTQVSLYSKYRHLVDHIYGPRDYSFLNQIRLFEIRSLLDKSILRRASFICELGAGTGFQSQVLSSRGYHIQAYDKLDSNYKNYQVFPVLDIQGFLDLPPESVDAIYTSNVVEHIADFSVFHNHCMSKLKRGGLYIHVVPNSTWRLITIFTYFFKYFHPPFVSHGKVLKSPFSEIFAFNKNQWLSFFSKLNSCYLESYFCNHLLYSGTSLFGAKLPIKIRSTIARVLQTGSTHTFILRKL